MKEQTKQDVLNLIEQVENIARDEGYQAAKKEFDAEMAIIKVEHEKALKDAYDAGYSDGIKGKEPDKPLPFRCKAFVDYQFRFFLVAQRGKPIPVGPVLRRHISATDRHTRCILCFSAFCLSFALIAVYFFAHYNSLRFKKGKGRGKSRRKPAPNVNPIPIKCIGD